MQPNDLCRICRAVAVLSLVGGCSSAQQTTTAASTSAATAATTASPAPTTTIGATSTTTTTEPNTARIVDPLAAADVGERLTRVERAAATGDGSVGQEQQLLYRYLAGHPEMDEAVIAALPDDVRPYVERVVRARQFDQARRAATGGSPPASDTVPAWTIIDPLPVAELRSYYDEAEAATGIAWFWLAAVHLQETRMGRIIGVSSAGAVGPMQFLPSTFEHCCVGDPTDAHDAIVGAATYLAQSGGVTDMTAALHQYNPNESYVAIVTSYAENLRDNPLLHAAYHAWQVFYVSSAGTIRLPVGYTRTAPVDATAYLAEHPQDLAG